MFQSQDICICYFMYYYYYSIVCLVDFENVQVNHDFVKMLRNK